MVLKKSDRGREVIYGTWAIAEMREIIESEIVHRIIVGVGPEEKMVVQRNK